MHSLETVSGLGINISCLHQAKFNLISRCNYEIRFYQARPVSGGVAKPGLNAGLKIRFVHGTFLLATYTGEEKKAR